MPWMYLLVAGFLEVLWAYAMKKSNGFTQIVPSIVTILAMVVSFWLLSLAMRSISLGTAYVIWTGIGAVGAFLVGIMFMAEPASALRLVAATLIVSGLLLMKMADG